MELELKAGALAASCPVAHRRLGSLRNWLLAHLMPAGDFMAPTVTFDISAATNFIGHPSSFSWTQI